jgi:hypothetical protein
MSNPINRTLLTVVRFLSVTVWWGFGHVRVSDGSGGALLVSRAVSAAIVESGLNTILGRFDDFLIFHLYPVKVRTSL